MVHVFVVFSLVSTVLHPRWYYYPLRLGTILHQIPIAYSLFYISFIVGFFFPVVRSFVVVAVFFVLYRWLWVKV